MVPTSQATRRLRVGHPPAEEAGAQLDAAVRIVVQPDLTLPGHPEAFVVGDMMTRNRLPGVGAGGDAKRVHLVYITCFRSWAVSFVGRGRAQRTSEGLALACVVVSRLRRGAANLVLSRRAP